MRGLFVSGARSGALLRRPILALSSALVALTFTVQAQDPLITSMRFAPSGDLEVIASFPVGYQHAVLEVIPRGDDPMVWQPLVSGPLSGDAGEVRFTLPQPGPSAILRAAFGASAVVPPATYSGLEHCNQSYGGGGFFILESAQRSHVLNRLAYGPSPADAAKYDSLGATAFINQQLDPNSIDESGNARLNDKVDVLFHSILPYGGEAFVSPGDSCTFFRGVSEPPAGWMDQGFDDSLWETGTTGLGYGDDDDATELTDMRFIQDVQPGYLSFYVRQTFELADPLAVDTFLLRVRYDDSFVAYLNGSEVARYNVTGSPPAFNTPADSSGGNVDNSNGAPYEFDLAAFKGNLVTGTNTLAFQVHNASLTSSDSSLIPQLVSTSPAPFAAIKGVDELQHLLHLRGIYSEKQLQAVLAEFWENHFTTDYDKVADYIEDSGPFQALVNQGADENLVQLQARTEAASMEFDEYQFFYDNALGNFGDMLLYSATSPSMLIYLDSILSEKDAPNENYPREILELHTVGVDNGYLQADIEELARCFTGWTLRKVQAGNKLPFPDSARTPPITPSIVVDTELPLVDAGANWTYFRGTSEPSPGGGGEATIDWTAPTFDDSGWEVGPSGFGYGDGDDNTVLTDMQFIPDSVDPINNPPVQVGYASAYARHEFTLGAGAYDELILEIRYDDGYVAYLNGTEIARSGNMAGSPPAYDYLASYGHEAASAPASINLSAHSSLLNAAPETNVLAVQIHNTSLNSSDVSLIPRILERTYTAESISETDPHGVWTFRFDPDEHDIGEKILFPGTSYEMTIPAGRTGLSGVDDAIEVIDALVGNQHTAEFICIKLVNKFVSDEISLGSYHAGTAPVWLMDLVNDAIAAWQGTVPAGNITNVLQTILDPAAMGSGFWVEGAKQSKVKTAIEYINSGFRALDAEVTSDNLPNRNEDLGMTLFKRNDPDGYDEKGDAWIDTLGFLERMKLGQALGNDLSFSYSAWDIDTTLSTNSILTPEDLIDYFDDLLFGGELPMARRSVFLEFANTDDTGASSPYDSLSAAQKTARLRDLTGLVLSTPEFQLQ